jgi:hypothetical protein
MDDVELVTYCCNVVERRLAGCLVVGTIFSCLHFFTCCVVVNWTLSNDSIYCDLCCFIL